MKEGVVFDGVSYLLRSPAWLLLLLLSPLFVWVLARSLANLPRPARVLSVSSRLAFLASLALGLSEPTRIASSQKVCTVLLVDVSDSVTDEALAEAETIARELFSHRRGDDLVRLVTFAKRPVVVDIKEDEPLRLSRHPDGLGAGTNVQAAMQLAQGLYPEGYLKRALLLSDGLENEGEMLAEALRASERGIRLFAIPYRHEPPPEVALQSLTLPDRIKVGETFDVRAEVYATRGGPARLRLHQGASPNPLEGTQVVELAPGTNEIRFRSAVRVSGEVTYDLRLEPMAEDTFEENNRLSSTIEVPGRPTVLYVEGDAPRFLPLASALERQGFDVDVRAPSAFPASLGELARFDFVVLSDTKAATVSESSQRLIERYLHETGGGFLFAGGPHGYGPGGWEGTTIERLLPVRMRAEKRKDLPSIALALVIDRSGSMSGLPMDMAKAAASATVDTLAPDDFISVIAFDSAPVRAVRMQAARHRSRIKGDIQRIQAGGGTEIFPALDAAYQDLSVTEARRKHVILLTDGRASSTGIRDLVTAMAADSITVTTVGLGPEVDDQLLSSIKDHGGGRYHKASDPSQLPRIFTREAEMVSKSATVIDYFPVRQTGNAAFLRGIDMTTAPYLSGFTATSMKPAPAQEILAHADSGEPILARWRVGLGYALAFTSDVKTRYAADWARWPAWPRFWGQLVREHQRQRQSDDAEMSVEIVGGNVRAVVDAFTPDDRFDNALESKLLVFGPQPGGEKREMPMRQTAPGRYEAKFPLDRFGSFLLRAEQWRRDDEGKLSRVKGSVAHVAYPYPAEYSTLEPDVGKLSRAAKLTSGAIDPELSSIFEPMGEEVSVDEPLWDRFVLAAIALLILDVFVRRVRLFARA